MSDNDHPFNSTEFARYMDTLGIKFDLRHQNGPREMRKSNALCNLWGKQYRLPMQKIEFANKNSTGFCYNVGQHLTLRPKSHLLNYYSTVLYAEESQTKDKEMREYNKKYVDRKQHTKPSIDVLDSSRKARKAK